MSNGNSSEKRTMVLQRTHKTLANGCEQLLLTLWDGADRMKQPSGKDVEPIRIVSGWAGCQNFRTRAQQVTGRCEPIPEGVYDLGPVEWCGKRGDWETIWPDIKSAACIVIDPDRRILFHLDASNDGTAGCCGTETNADLARILYWRETLGADRLIVDHGLGTVLLPGSPRKLEHAKGFAHPGGARLILAGKEVKAISIRVDKGKAFLTDAAGVQRELSGLSLDATFKA